MDWEEMKKNIAPLYTPTPCSCGGSFRVQGQDLCIDPETKKFYDKMLYRCDKCGKETTQTADAPHLNKLLPDPKLE